MKENIILFYPQIDYISNYKFFWSPLSLIAISKLVKDDYNVIIIDGNVNRDYESILKEHINDAICIGISAMTGGNQISDGIQFAKLVRSINNKIPLVWGGPHCTALPYETIEHELVDILIRGQGEITFKEVVDALKAGASLQGILGVSYKLNNKVLHNDPRPICDINNLPDMPWDLINVEDYIRDDITVNNRTINLVTSCGCPYGCKFCYEGVAYKQRWTGLSSERVLGEIDRLICRHNINGVKFYDADFFVNPSRVKEICNGIINRAYKLKWAASAHVKDIIRLKNDMELIKKSGCTRMLIGVESGSDEMLELINKKTNVEEILEVAKLCNDYGIIASFTFIVGFPFEADKNGADTKALIEYITKEYKIHEIRVHLFAPYPGTALFPIAIEKGFNPPKGLENWADYNYYQPQTPWINEELIKLVDYTSQWNLNKK